MAEITTGVNTDSATLTDIGGQIVNAAATSYDQQVVNQNLTTPLLILGALLLIGSMSK